MKDKRNIVIKVKYPVSGKAASDPTPKMVTEWNIKRILVAAAILILALVLLVFYIVSDDEPETSAESGEINTADKTVAPPVELKDVETKDLAIPKQVTNKTSLPVKQKKEPYIKNNDIKAEKVIKKPANEKTQPERNHSKTAHVVSRAVLTDKINNKEPVGEISRTLDVKANKPVWVYYFNELNSLNGNKVYHEWLKNGSVVSKQELVVSKDAWRTSSRKLLSDSDRGNWAVRLVDKNGRVLNEKSFKVE
jgi:hypothetical protein